MLTRPCNKCVDPKNCHVWEGGGSVSIFLKTIPGIENGPLMVRKQNAIQTAFHLLGDNGLTLNAGWDAL